MTGREDSYSPIHDSDLEPFVKEANRLLSRIRWRPELSADKRVRLAQKGWSDSALAANTIESALPEEFKVLDGDAMVLSQDTNTVLEVLRDGAAIGLFVQDDVAMRIGLAALEQADSLRGNGMGEGVRFRKMLLSATQLFTLCYYVLWHLRDFRQDTRTVMRKPFPGFGEIVHDFSHGEQASVYRSVLHYYAQLIRPENGLIDGREELIDVTVQYFQAVMNHTKDYVIPGLQEAQLFGEVRYSLEGSGFAINGFEVEYTGVETEVPELKQVLFSEIIGNHVPKNRLSRTVRQMFLRDKETGQNPSMRYGGIPNVFFAQGKPGAGKTLLAGAVCTLALELSKKTGLKVNIMIYPRNIVSKYQGVSSERATIFWKKTNSPDAITVVIMDEAEQLIPDRDDDRASSGSKAGTNAFLVATEGVDQVHEGLRLIFLATNHAHQCDSAARSRAKEKVEVNGAETKNDYMDFIHLMLGMQDEVFRKVLQLDNPVSYVFMADQENPPNADALKDDSPIVHGIEHILASVQKRFNASQYDFFGELFYQFQRANPGFSLRDLRNIIEATIFALSQYDIPDSFFDPESPDYHPLSLTEKEQKLYSLLEAHLHKNKVSFADEFLDNAHRQMREIEKVEQIEHDRAVENFIKQIRIQADAVAKAEKHGIKIN